MAAQQNAIVRDGKQYREIKEGLARILVPADAPTQVDPRAAKVGEGQPNAPTVFYNPIQQFNRDLSVLAIRAFGEDLLAVRRARKKPRPSKRKAGGPVDKTEKGEGEDDGAGGVPAEKRAKTEHVQEETANVQDGHASTTTNGATSLETFTNNETTTTTAPPTSNPARTPKFKILDALSATGLRALRYAHEIPFASSITAVDLSAEATASIAANVAHNALVPKINIITGNALSHMYTFAGTETGPPAHTVSKKYDVIDLDPYGTAAPFLDAAVQAVADGGLLCVTCTDAGVWASCGYPEKTYALYGGTPVKGLHSHEAGLRLILHAVAAAAARYGAAVEPLLSLSIDFYARVFVRVRQSPAEVKMLAGKTMLVYGCDGGCGAWTTQPLARHQPATNKDGSTRWQHGLAQAPVAGPYCGFCGFKTHLSGPMWGGPLHNAAFIELILSYLPHLDDSTYETKARIEGMLSTALEETTLYGEPDQDTHDTTQTPAQPSSAPAEAQDTTTPSKIPPRPIPPLDPALTDRHPFFFIPSALAKVLHCQAPSDAAIRGALRGAGYRATRSHVKPGTVRTDAPWSFVWHVMREWVRQRAPLKEGGLKKGTAGWAIMGGDAPRGAGADADGRADGGVNGEGDAGTSVGQMDPAMAMTKAGASGSDVPALGARKVVFDEQMGREEGARRLVRYQANPRANWGPMMRARKRAEGGVGAAVSAGVGVSVGVGAGAAGTESEAGASAGAVPEP